MPSRERRCRNQDCWIHNCTSSCRVDDAGQELGRRARVATLQLANQRHNFNPSTALFHCLTALHEAVQGVSARWRSQMVCGKTRTHIAHPAGQCGFISGWSTTHPADLRVQNTTLALGRDGSYHDTFAASGWTWYSGMRCTRLHIHRLSIHIIFQLSNMLPNLAWLFNRKR
jgi:hypothetical protein